MSPTPLILVPGLLCDASLWHHQISALAETCECIVSLPEAATISGMAQAALDIAPPKFALAGLNVSTLIVAASADSLIPPENQIEIHERISGSKFALIPDCGHLSTIEAPGRVSALLSRWILESTC